MSEPRNRLNVALAERYTIERELGHGGMATVYLAQDVKHDRKVAVKVLRPELAAVLGADRFVQEIKTTASLQHPHILPLFDSGEADGFLFYVMPYIEGETLRDKLNRETQLGIEEAVRITTDVAEALHYAHEHGVIHRDIKPENILLHNGRPTVADFGIALAVSAAAGGRMTETGMSLGTPHYMSPEQATADKDLSSRSDIYSLGAVLYEMLTGDPPHTGSSAQQIIMKIVTEEAAPVTRNRKSVPPNVAAAVGRALEKLPADRFDSATQFASALGDVTFRHASTALTTDSRATARAGMMSGRPALVAVTAVGVIIGFAAGVWFSAVRKGHRGPVSRTAIELAVDQTFPGRRGNADRPIQTALAFSPDGRTVVFVARGADSVSRLYRRPLDAMAATPIDGTAGAEAPFFSPDGGEIGYWADGHLRRMPVDGGAPVEIAAVADYLGASWGDDDHIVFRDGARSGLARVRVSGEGAVESLPSHPNAMLPHVLPGGRAVLYTVQDDAALEGRRVVGLDLTSAQTSTVIENASDGRYVKTGHLVFARTGTLMAIPFDPAVLTVSGSATGVLRDVMHSMNGWNTTVWTNAAQYAVSDAGHLAFIEGGITPSERNDVAWLDRSGNTTPLGIEPNWYLVARLAPGGDRLALASPGLNGGVWTVDLTRRNAIRRIATGWIPAVVWTPDGQEIYYDDGNEVWRVRGDGTSEPEPVEGVTTWPAAFSTDGRDLIYIDESAGENVLRALTLSTGESRVLVEEPTGLAGPAISPDGRWLAYALNDDSEIVVRSYPDMGNRTVVANSFVYSVAWSRGGRELIYGKGGDRYTLMAQAFDTGTGRPTGDPEPIPTPDNIRGMSPVRSFDVTDDGERIVVIVRSLEVPAVARRIGIVLNWFAELEAQR